MIDADPIVLSGLVTAVYTLVCLVLVVIVIHQNDRIEALEAREGILERKEYRLEDTVSAQESTLAARIESDGLPPLPPSH